MNKPKKPKKISFRLHDRTPSPAPSDPYAVLDRAVAAWHPHLAAAKVVIAWKDFTPDKDGHVVLGKAKKAADLDRHMHDVDFVIFLNEEAWVGELNDAQRLALIDHECAHCGVDVDENGDPRLDDSGRVVYRMRKHDLEEFHAVVRRHGTWLRDIEDMVSAAMEHKKKSPLFRVAEGSGGEGVAGGGDAA